MNLSEFRKRKTWGAPWRLLVDAPRDLGPEAMDNSASDPDPFAWYENLGLCHLFDQHPTD